MTIFDQQLKAGVRRFLVHFDGRFETCSVRVGYAKEVGQRSSVIIGTISKSPIEIASVSIGEATCSVQGGN